MNVQSSRVRALALLSSGLMLAAPACGHGAGDARNDTSAAEADAVKVGPENIAVVARKRIESGPAVSGSLTPEREGKIRAEVGGAVLKLYAELGQRVAADQLLAQIDDAALQDAFLGARSGVTNARSAADIAEREERRAETLSAAGAIAERDLELARRGDVAARAALADAQSRLTSAQKQLEHAKVRAPFAGVVSERQVSVGDVVSLGTPLFSVVDPTSMRLEASVPAEQLSAVRPGLPVQFTVSGYPQQFTGHVSRISPVADPTTRQVKIFVSIPNEGRALVGGLFAEGRISAQSHEAATAPVSAVDLRGLHPWVLLLKNGRAERREVDLGLRDDQTETYEIVRGVVAGDTLMIGAAQGISPGTPVRLSAPADRPTSTH
jgi:membrane fusion protein, multidrug efflux system